VLTIDISPPTNVYATFGRLNYSPWHAIAEFVDNATQSYYAGRSQIGYTALPELAVHIRYKAGDSLVVRDNAVGMTLEELSRAIRLSTPPPDRSGRSEFGMGMKTAACWFGSKWSVSTTALGERWRFRLVFDVDAIAKGDDTNVEILREPAREDEHGTVLTIERLARPIAGRQIEKTKKLLASIYRHDLARKDVRITWNGEDLRYTEPTLMPWEVDGNIAPCRIPIDIQVKDPFSGVLHRVTGWAGCLQKMSELDAGFALMRRGRMIIGGPGANWRPRALVGSLNSHSGKRMVGELEMDDFPVNFTKDGFAWDGGLEEELVATLEPVLDEIKGFANNARVSKKQVEPEDFVRAVDEVQRGVDHPTYRHAIGGAGEVESRSLVGMDRPHKRDATGPAVRRDVPQELVLPVGSETMTARLVLVHGGPQQSWLSISDIDANPIVVNLNTGNRFVEQHLHDETERTLVAKFALAVATAEAQARLIYGDEVPPDELRHFLNLTLDHSASA
jgi:hypothetical protein